MKAGTTSQRWLELLGSKQLGVFLFVALITISFMLMAWATTSPNEIVYKIGTSLPMRIILVLLTINNVLFIKNYLPVVRNLTAADNTKPIVDALRKRRHYFRYEAAVVDSQVVQGLAGLLKRRRYHVTFSRDMQAFRAVRGLKTAWGTIAFHCSFILIIIAIIVSPFVWSQASATVAEGETFDTGTGQLFKVRPEAASRAKIPRFSFKLLKVNPTNWNKTLLVKSLYARLKPETGPDRDIRCTVAWKPTWATYVTLETFGFAPLYELKTNQGETVDYGYVKLDTYPPGKQDHFAVAGNQFDVFLKVLPDAKVIKGRFYNDSPAIKNPGFLVRVKRGGRTVATHFLRLGQSMRLGPYRLAFPKLRYWAEVEFLYNPMLYLLWLGFILGNLAVIWRLVFYRREVIVLSQPDGDKGVLHLATKSDYNPNLFAEDINRLVHTKTKMRLTPGGDNGETS